MARYDYEKYTGKSSGSTSTTSSGRYDYSKYMTETKKDTTRAKETAEAMRAGQLPPIDVRRSALVQQIESAPPITQPAEREKPLLARVQENIYNATLGPIQDTAARVATGITDALTLGQGRRIMQKGPDFVTAPLQEGLRPAETTGEKVADIAGEIIGSAAPVAGAYGLFGRLGGAALRRAAPNAGRTTQRLVTGAAAGTGYGLAREGLDAAINEESTKTLPDRAQSVALDAALFGGGDAAISAAARVFGPRLKQAWESFLQRNRQPSQTLALPEPRQRGNANTAQTPDVVVVPEGPRGLPEPYVRPPTRARVGRRQNPYEQRLEELFTAARERGLTPGREVEELESLWSQMARRDEPNLNDLIDMAYPPERPISPDMVSRARNYQQSREAAGVPLPVRSSADRYRSGMMQPAAEPRHIVGRRTSEQQQASRQQPVIDITPNPPTSSGRTAGTALQQGVRERGLNRTLRESERLAPEVAEGLESAPNRKYQPITNAETVANANRRINQGLDSAEAFALQGRGRLTAERVATGFRLIDEYQKSGNFEKAVNVADTLSKRLTEAGQSVQAASIWNRLTPEGALLYAQRKVDEINTSLSKSKPEVKITPQQAADITNSAGAIQRSGASRERAGEVLQLMEEVSKGKTLTAEQRELVTRFIEDAKEFVTPTKASPVARVPKEINAPRVRDRVVSYFDEAEKAARERMLQRRNTLSANPLDAYADMAIIAASKIAKGTVKFADISEQLIREFGDEIRPHVRSIYNQAQKILSQNAKRISEEQISQAEKVAQSYLKRNEGKLSSQDTEVIQNLAKQVSELSGTAQRAASRDLQEILSGFERAGVGRKVAAAQYISMLLNPVTQVRNIVGNEILYRLERLQRMAATPIDWTYSKLTGKDRTITFRSGPMSWDNFFAPTRDYAGALREGSEAGWRGVNPEGLTTSYDISGQAFRSKLNPLTYMEKTLGAVMKGFDYAAFTRAANQRMREMAYLDAINSGVSGRQNIQRHIDQYLANLDDNVAAVAKEYGKYVTLQDKTALSKALQSFKRGLNRITTGSRDFGVGSVVLPFAQTPANLLMRAIDYSPAGFLKAIGQAYQVLRSRDTDLTRADVIESVTRALFGTGLTGVGLWLAHLGVLRGETSGDRDVRELERLAGISQYQLNGSALQRMMGAMVTGNLKDVQQAAKLQNGDTLWQYEWAQPTSIPLALGANIVQERKQATLDLAKKGQSEGALKQSSDVVLGAANTLLNTSVLSGLQEAFNVPPGEDNYIKAFAQNIVKQVPSMFTPSMISRMNQVFDPNVRETYSPDPMEQILNPAQSRIPYLAQQLPQRVNTLGQPVTRENNVFDVFLSPSQRSKFKPTPEAQLIMDVLAETGDTRIAPRAVQRYITGTDPATRQSKRVDLTGEQYVRFQQIVGQETARQLGRIPQHATTEQKVKMILDALNRAAEVGRREMKRELNLR